MDTLCVKRSHFPFDVVTARHLFHHFKRAFTVKSLQLFFRTLGVVFGVTKENKVVNFEFLCSGFLVIAGLWYAATMLSVLSRQFRSIGLEFCRLQCFWVLKYFSYKALHGGSP